MFSSTLIHQILKFHEHPIQCRIKGSPSCDGGEVSFKHIATLQLNSPSKSLRTALQTTLSFNKNFDVRIT